MIQSSSLQRNLICLWKPTGSPSIESTLSYCHLSYHLPSFLQEGQTDDIR
jgi:hypothetical protein